MEFAYRHRRMRDFVRVVQGATSQDDIIKRMAGAGHKIGRKVIYVDIDALAGIGILVYKDRTTERYTVIKGASYQPIL